MKAEPKRQRAKFGEILVQAGIITEQQLELALTQQRKSKGRLGEVLVEMELASSEEIISALSQQLEIPHVWLRRGLIDPTIVTTIPKAKAEAFKVIPMFKVGRALTVATADPQSIFLLDDLAKITGCEIQPVLCRASDIDTFIEEYYATGEDGEKAQTLDDSFLSTLEESDLEVVEEGAQASIEELEKVAEGSPIINLVNLIIRNGIRDGASDIHIEPDLKTLRVRYRIDGILFEANPTVLTLDLHSAIISRLKVMANLDIAERRMPQDGRIRVTIDGNEVDLRFSSMPTILGEKIVLRILDRRSAVLDLLKLGFNEETLTRFKKVLLRPYGLILTVGPTGSGKTTTLYSALNLIRSMEKNIVTIEDPVEYQLEIINQVQVEEKVGLSFAKVLRSVLRQDPDIVMVGEIRDRETAEIAIQASLTGHLVLSTLHTNESSGAIARLLDMGIEPFLISSSVTCVLAQRLVRTICEECKTEYIPPDSLVQSLGWEPDKKLRLSQGRGCDNCYDSGHKGRLGIYELLVTDEELQALILKNPSTEEIQKQRRSVGQKFLVDDGFDKVRKGLTTIEEIKRVLFSEQDFGGM